MSEVKHTPLPWTCKNGVGVIFGPDCHVAVCGDFGDDELVPFNAERWRADAAFIVTACNSHHAMLEALEEVTDDLEAEIEAKRGSVLERTTERDLASVHKARAAIRLAKGAV